MSSIQWGLNVQKAIGLWTACFMGAQTVHFMSHFEVLASIVVYLWATNMYMWLDFGKPTELSHWAYSILLAQLMATLIHYTFTLPLSGLVDWSAFLKRLLPTLSIQDWDNGTHGGHYMEGMGVKFTPGIGGRLLRHSSVFGPMAGTSGTHS